jgi:hypothetical protein
MKNVEKNKRRFFVKPFFLKMVYFKDKYYKYGTA